MENRFTEVIETSQGKLRGIEKEGGICVFKGIPYAKPPVGELRFKPSQLGDGWEGVKDCTEFGNSSPQNPMTEGGKLIWTEEFLIQNTNFSEDCLTLNIWTKKDAKKMPVVLYFYGGGYVSGGTSCEIYDGTYLAQNGVLYVSFNHRDGTLGLFSCEELSEESETKTSGNYMLYDALTALRWIRENIEAFGGDPENVTIWGQSSGAGEVNALSVSDLVRGYFKRVVTMGYNNYLEHLFAAPWRTKEQGYELGGKIVEALGSLENVKKAPFQELLPLPSMGAIQIDGHFVKENFNTGVRDGKTNDYPMVMGAVPGDFMMTKLSILFLQADKTEEATLEVLRSVFKEAAEELLGAYGFGQRDYQEALAALKSDYLIAPMLLFAKGRVEAGAKDTFIYFFDHPMPGPNVKRFGAFHSAEVPYFMNFFSDKRKEYWREEDFRLGEKASNTLLAFLKNGHPQEAGFAPSTGNSYLHIGTEGLLEESWSDEKLKLWERAFAALI